MSMNPPLTGPLASPAVHWPFELRFASLFHPGRALSFPCDARGRVELDRLSERARLNYLFARAVVGRDYDCPVVVPSTMPRALA